MAKKKNFQDAATLELLQDTLPTVPSTSPQYIYEATPAHETKSKRVQLLLQPSLLKFAKDEAKKRSISMNEYICRLLIREKNV